MLVDDHACSHEGGAGGHTSRHCSRASRHKVAPLSQIHDKLREGEKSQSLMLVA